MSKYFSEFLKINHIKAIYKDNKKNFLCVDRGRINQALLCSFFSVLINHKYKFNPIILSDLKNEKIIKLYQSFGLNKFLIGFRFFLLFTHPVIFLKSFFLTIKVIFLIKKNSLYWFVNKFEVCGIRIGDLVHDYYIRNNHSYLNPKIDIKFINILFKALFRTLNISKIIKEKNIKYIVLGTETYAHNDGITLRLGLKNNIPVIEPSLATLDFFKYHTNHIKHGKRTIFYNNKVKLVKNFEKNIAKIDNFLKKRFLGKVKTGYTHFLHLKKTNRKSTNISRSKYLKLNGFKKNEIKKIILFSCHAFSDANHGIGNNFLFLDYYDHLKKTLEFVNKINNPNILWIVRPNPTSEFAGEYELVRHLLKKFNNKKIILSSKKITSFDLLKVCDNVITGRGTVGMEFACLGKYPITVGSGVYSKLDFSLEFRSKKKYFQQLKDIENVKRLSKKQILLAKQTLYYLENNTDKFFVDFFQDREKKIFIKNSKLLIDRSILPYIQRYSKKSIFCKKLLINLKNFNLNNNSYVEYILKKI